MGESPSEFKLKCPPYDGISAVRFGPKSTQHLLISSWDGGLYLYDVVANNLRLSYRQQFPLLDCCFQDTVHAFYGGLNGQLFTCDFNTSTETVIGSHNDTIRCVEYCSDVNVMITGSWDSTVKLWDPRANGCAGTLNQPDKVYTMSVCGDRLIVGTAGRKVLVWDMRNVGYVQQRRESSLKYQTRCIRSFPNKLGYVLSSIEGRVAVEYLDPSPEIQKRKYAFKCHRVKEDGIEKIYPVTAIAFHNGYSTFASGGCDGFVNIWDGFNKKRLCQFHRYTTSISALEFSHDGTVLAIASSYMYESGMVDKQPDVNVFIRNVTDQESKPK